MFIIVFYIVGKVVSEVKLWFSECYLFIRLFLNKVWVKKNRWDFFNMYRFFSLWKGLKKKVYVIRVNVM